MKLDQLKEGEVYTCKLSGAKTLIVKQTGKTEIPPKKEGEAPTFEEKEVTTGKIACVNPENGDIKYFFNEIYDGQLTELNQKN